MLTVTFVVELVVDVRLDEDVCEDVDVGAAELPVERDPAAEVRPALPVVADVAIVTVDDDVGVADDVADESEGARVDAAAMELAATTEEEAAIDVVEDEESLLVADEQPTVTSVGAPTRAITAAARFIENLMTHPSMRK